MRGPIPLDIPAHLVVQARAYTFRSHDLDAVCYVLEDYPKVVAQVRQLERRLSDLDQESAELDELLAELKAICRRVLDL